MTLQVNLLLVTLKCFIIWLIYVHWKKTEINTSLLHKVFASCCTDLLRLKNISKHV